MAKENQKFCIIDKTATLRKLQFFCYHQQSWNANYLPALIKDF